MTKPDDNDKKPNKKGSRTDRLAAALRQNLRRRKAQVRQRAAPKQGPSSQGDKPS
jgi:hypothetical protein